ncbi:MAG: class I SAM-dependent methyltransferase [Pseudomonadota bacterium]
MRSSPNANRKTTLAKDLPSTGGDDTGDRVRAQYEQHPYPRWLGLTVPTPGSRRALIMRATGDTSWRDRSLQVLIAGCGTGRHALMAALGYGPRTNTLAVDVSRTSLGYAARMAETYKVKALGFAHGDLRDLTKLPPGCLPAKGFDVIESIGVLHHLPDTAEGLIALAEHLKPGGVIQLGLYRAGGRRHVALARAEIEDLGLDGTKDDDIRQYRAHVLARPDHEIFPALAHNRDFYSLAGCRDLLFHARERDIEMAKIAGLLEQAGLEFLTMQMPDGVRQAFIADHGEAALTDLGLWQSFEVSRPDLFDAMYRFWAIKPR